VGTGKAPRPAPGLAGNGPDDFDLGRIDSVATAKTVPEQLTTSIAVADIVVVPEQFSNSIDALSGLPDSQNLKFERDDWTLFRTIEGLQQKAGVSKDKLSRLVLKELADNGLDTGAKVDIGTLPGGGYFVTDDGSGIDGTPEEIARLFSIHRPMISSKLLRLPIRGALGNGLRVVAGAVLASEGTLVVSTRNRRIVLRPERDGTTTVVAAKPIKFPVGARVEVGFGPALPCDADTLFWATIACQLSRTGQVYIGKASPWWYDLSQFHELLYASGDRPVRELIAQLDGCSGGKAGEIVAAAGLARAICKNLIQQQAAKLLSAARDNARPVQPKRLGAVGPYVFDGCAYACSYGVEQLGSIAPFAEIPFVVEAWARPTRGKTFLRVSVNRTPVTGEIKAARDNRDIDFFGCGLAHTVAAAPKDSQFAIQFNIMTPYMPITSDGKAPDFKPFLSEIQSAVGKAVRKAHRPNAGSGTHQVDIVLDNLDAAIAHVSGGHKFRFNQRQLLYRIRPIVKNEMNATLTTAHFNAIITDYEAEHGEIPLMYREPRGSIYHPHRRETFMLGTLMVERYQRPVWTYNKIVYIEKEGANEALKDKGWPERHDCSVISSKGFTTRAVKDLIDKLAEHDEPIEVFCVHDADGPGTVIYQTFQEATKARGARKIKIINLGLEPWEALDMGLEVETIEEGKRRRPVADYVLAREDTAPDGETWEEWLQTHRVELNAMTTPQFIAWLDRKMAEHSTGKLIPPEEVIAAELEERLEAKVRGAITEGILREAGLEDQIVETIKAIEKRPSGGGLVQGIKGLFKRKAEADWRAYIETLAAEFFKKARRL
jgi:hypothetical protein